ncbi:unnamed protein product [Gongylonema pulchrum]|uniref:7TM_GPCR_Srx domain-containing protein n=1 Tax=Gongylonema pulchrum TaxID=637853 RepID=A0A183EZQ7_9BILA|nr:unnamed protein product [Gongylonema pulchrum]
MSMDLEAMVYSAILCSCLTSLTVIILNGILLCYLEHGLATSEIAACEEKFVGALRTAKFAAASFTIVSAVCRSSQNFSIFSYLSRYQTFLLLISLILSNYQFFLSHIFHFTELSNFHISYYRIIKFSHLIFLILANHQIFLSHNLHFIELSNFPISYPLFHRIPSPEIPTTHSFTL